MPTKYKIFLSKGVLSPCNLRQGALLPGPLWTTRSQSVLPTIQNWMTPMHKRYAKGKGVRSGGCGPSSHFLMRVGGNEPLVGIYNWSRWKHNLWWKWYKLRISGRVSVLQSYVNFTLGGNRTSWTFKVLKSTSFRGLRTLDPRQGRHPDPTRGPKELLKLLNKSR